MINGIFILSACLFSLGAAYHDIKTFKIPNKYNLFALLFALGTRLLIGIFLGWDYLWSGFLGMVIGFALFFPFFAFRLAGAGDVKLLSALGMILGWRSFLWVFCLTCLCDGIILIIRYTRLLAFVPVSGMATLFSVEANGKRKNPYGLPVAIGCLVCFLIYVLQPNFLIFSMSIIFPDVGLFG